MQLNYQELLELESIDGYSILEQLTVLKFLFDLSLDSKNLKGIELGLTLSNQIKIETLSEHEIVLFHYYIANGWTTKRILRAETPKDSWDFQMEEIKKEIYHLRKAISSVGFDSIGPLRQCQVYTNFGNALNFIGRFSEAQLAWTKALEISPDSSMTLANKARGLFHYGKYLYDEMHTKIFIFYSFDYCKKAIKNIESVFLSSKEQIIEFYKSLEKMIPYEIQNYLPDLNEYSLGEDIFLREYRQWCLKNHLYINPLNDLGEFTIATHDCLNLPTLIIEANKPPSWINLYNQIKQEFGTSRFMLYESLIEQKPHYSDIDILVVETYENVEYSYCLEKTKIAFRTCYSILDKMAFLLNDYLQLAIPQEKVYFKSLWYNNNKKELRDFFKTSNNWALRGLYWLSKDIFEKGDDFNNVIEPEAKELDVLRNHIEHKALKIISTSIKSSFEYQEEKDIAYTITREEFEKKTLKLLSLVRSALIYLSLAINQEEQKREYPKGNLLPIHMEEIPHYKKGRIQNMWK